MKWHMSSTYEEGGVTISVSEQPFFKIANDKYAKERTITCGQCDGVATHRVEREETGIIIRTHYCKPCFEDREP
jgi:hypothetical protein